MRIANGLWIVAAFAVAAMLVWAASPTERSLNLQRVAPDKLELFAGLPYSLARSPEAAEQRWALDDYDPGTVNTHLQMHIDQANEFDQIGEVYFLLPAIGSEARFFVNAIPLARSQPHDYPGVALGRDYLLGLHQSEQTTRAKNRIDVVLVEGTGDYYIPAVFMGNRGTQEQTVWQFELWNTRLESLVLFGGMFGLLCSIIGLATRQMRGLSIAVLLASIATLVVAFSGAQSDVTAAMRWLAVITILGSSGAVAMNLRRAETPTTGAILGFAIFSVIASLVALSLLLGFSIGDFFMTRSLANLGQLPLIALGAPLLVITQSRAVLNQLASARLEAASKTAIIQQQEQELHEQIKSRAVVEERQRFMRDMHDGVGGQLLSLLVRLKAKKINMDQVEHEISGGITDLRLIVDSLDRAGNSLSEALSIFEVRARQQLHAADMELHWEVDLAGASDDLDTRDVLNVFRLLQEVLSNAIRHSGGKNFGLSAHCAAGTGSTEIRLWDDGSGFDIAGTGHGKGLQNIRERARKAGGTIEIAAASPTQGTQILLTIPRDNAA